MAFNVKTIQDGIVPGIVAGAASALLVYLAKLLPAVSVTFTSFNVREKMSAGIGTAVGDKIASYLGGFVVPNLGLVFITAFFVMLVGLFIRNLGVPFFGKNTTMRFAGVLFYGSLATTAILSLMSGSNPIGIFTNWVGIVVLFLYSMIVGWVMSLAYNNIPMLSRQMPNIP